MQTCAAGPDGDQGFYDPADGFWVACGKNQAHVMQNTPCKDIHVLRVELRPTAHVICFHNKNTHERSAGPARLQQHMMNYYELYMCVCVFLSHICEHAGTSVLPCDS